MKILRESLNEFGRDDYSEDHYPLMGDTDHPGPSAKEHEKEWSEFANNLLMATQNLDNIITYYIKNDLDVDKDIKEIDRLLTKLRTKVRR